MTGIDEFNRGIGGNVAPPSDSVTGKQSGFEKIVEGGEGYSQRSGCLLEGHNRGEPDRLG